MRLLSVIMGVILISMASCSREPKDLALFHQVIADYVQIIAKNELLFAYGTGGSMCGGPQKNLIKEFSVAFRSKKLVDLTEARAITIRCVEQLCSIVNANEEIRPFLEHYPYPPAGADLTLVFLPFDESDPHSEKIYIRAVYVMHGKIYYNQYNGEKKNDILALLETFEEALERNTECSKTSP